MVGGAELLVPTRQRACSRREPFVAEACRTGLASQMRFNALPQLQELWPLACLLELSDARGADGATPPPHEVERDFRFAGLA